ncbi:MAG: adenylosuccinate lyase, partial [Gemmatimonadota bacterium]
AGFTAATQWFERTLDDSANRRIAVAESFLGTDAVLLLAHNVAAGLVVRPGVIRDRLEHEMPFLATEAILMHAVRRGGDRQDLHERIRQHSVAAADRLKDHGGSNDLPDRIAGDVAFGMSRDDIVGILDPSRHVGRAPQQVEAYLEEIADVLERAEVGQAPELRA